MTDRTTPYALLVHGLWHGAWCWDAVRAHLREQGVDSVAVDLSLTDLAADVQTTRSALDQQDRPAVLVGHSYGGAVITDAGAHPLVRHLVYLAAFELDEGESISRVLPAEDLPQTHLADAFRFSEETHEISLDPKLGVEILYNDVPAEVAAQASARFRPVQRRLFRGTPEYFAWRTVPSTYVVCTEDLAVHPELERAMARRATKTLEWPTGHCPMASRPRVVADLIARKVEEAK